MGDFLVDNENKMLMLSSDLNCFILFCKSVRDLLVLISVLSVFNYGKKQFASPRAKLKAFILWSNICYLEWNLKTNTFRFQISILCTSLFKKKKNHQNDILKR